VTSAPHALIDRSADAFRGLQDEICAALEELDGTGRFREDAWLRPGGGGGRTRVLERGTVLEKGGVNFSDVEGELPAELVASMPGPPDVRSFRATGISLVLHPVSPMVPAVHANFRCIAKGDAVWFGGGADLTPTYAVRDDAVAFHRAWKEVCDRHDPAYYPRFKKTCDEYFYLPHRGETRGVGGIFFDHLQPRAASDAAAELERLFAFVLDAGRTFLPAYLPLARRRLSDPWGEREKAFQLVRRGRYVEFNLLYDRGTVFGLKTGGRTESILMSLPPQVHWTYAQVPEAGSREAELADYLRPQDWLGLDG
jgi:coproporphyrinogen III oxidase